MKILFINLTESPAEGGGGEIVLWQQIIGLQKYGVKCALLVTHRRLGLRKLDINGVTVWKAGLINLYWPNPSIHRKKFAKAFWHLIDIYNPFMTSNLKRVIAAESPDVISIHGQAGWSSAIYTTCRKAKIPIVQTLHGHYLLCPASTMYRKDCNCATQCTLCKLMRIPHKALTQDINTVVGVSEYILKRHIKAGYFKRVPARTVLHNVPSLPEPNSLTSSGHEKGALIRFGYIGRLEHEKGVLNLIESFRSIPTNSAELWIAGAGGNCESYLRKLPLPSNIRLLGYVNSFNFYHQIDCTIVPSLINDTLPGVVYESLSFGKPVIGANRGGIPEMIRPGENGFLFDPENRQNLPSLILQLIKDPNMLDALSKGASASTCEFLNIHEWIKKWIKIYKDAINSTHC